MHGKRPTISSLHGIVAAAHPLAAQAGAKLLASGGNAFDAAAATAAALNVVEPFMSGLAGLGYATCYVAAQKRVRVLDFVPPVPSRLPVERFTRREDLQRGALSVGTPGNLAGWAELVRAYGKKPLNDALQPAIALARDGFALAEFGVAEFNEQIPLLRAQAALYDDWAKNYTGGSGAVALGQIMRQPDLARTLEALASKGPGYLYGGALGETIVAHLAKARRLPHARRYQGGQARLEGAADRELSRPHHQYAAAPSEAFQFLLTLRILDGFDLARLERNGVEHLDTRLARHPARGTASASPTTIRPRHARPDLVGAKRRAAAGLRAPRWQAIDGPTEQWTPPPAGPARRSTTPPRSRLRDREGNVVCVTQSLGSPFGSGVVVPGTGLCLNNFLYWADVNPLSPNRTKPGRCAARVHGAQSISLRERQAGAGARHAR